uniref:CHCH domain-containing protein n=1 Tax=Trieres chinensis TaxID=1514140 RepID=A0A7S1ZEW9_TRICV
MTENKSADFAKIERDANPAPDSHNEGQPIRREEDERGLQRSKFFTDCSKQHSESLRCIEDNYEQKDVCQPFFDAYKACRREENQRRLEENKRRIAAAGGSDFCVIQ